MDSSRPASKMTLKKDLSKNIVEDEVIVNKVVACDGIYGGSFAGNPACFVKVNNRVREKHFMLRVVNQKAHKNILSFWGTHRVKNGDNYFIFQPFEYRVIDYIGESGPAAWRAHVDSLNGGFLGILKGIVEGMDYLHKLELSHGNLDPWTTYVDEYSCLKIGGLTSCSKLTNEKRENDFKQAAKYFAFLFSSLAGTGITKEQYENTPTRYIINLMYPTAAEAKKVVNTLMDGNGAAIDIWSKVLVLPWIWPAEKRLLFFKVVQEVLCDSQQTYIIDRLEINALFQQCSPYMHGWVEGFGGCIMDVQDPYDAQMPQSQRYMGEAFTCFHRRRSVVELINFIRNLYSHHFQIGQKLISQFGDDYNYLGNQVEDLEFLCRRLFPKLLVLVYAELERQQDLHQTVVQLQRFYN